MQQKNRTLINVQDQKHSKLLLVAKLVPIVSIEGHGREGNLQIVEYKKAKAKYDEQYQYDHRGISTVHQPIPEHIEQTWTTLKR